MAANRELNRKTCQSCKYGLSDVYYTDDGDIWVYTCEREGLEPYIENPNKACEYWEPNEHL